MSCCHIVGRLWPSPLTSVMPHRLSSLSIGGDVGRFPHRAFRRLAVAEQHVGPVVGLDPPRVQRACRRRRRCPGRAIRSRRRRTADAASGDPRDRSRCAQLQQLARDRTRRPRPTPRREPAPRVPSTARTDRCRDGADPADRTASRRRTARPRCRPPNSSWSDDRCRLRTSTSIESIRSRVAMFFRAGISVDRSIEVARGRFRIADSRFGIDCDYRSPIEGPSVQSAMHRSSPICRALIRIRDLIVGEQREAVAALATPYSRYVRAAGAGCAPHRRRRRRRVG